MMDFFHNTLNRLRQYIEELPMEYTTAEKILDIQEDTEMTEKNHLEFFDTINLLELYENDLKSRRLNLNLEMSTCRWLKYKKIFTDKKLVEETK